MLVCNVSLRPPRSAITAAIAEAVTAADVTSANSIFAALVDDPASAFDATDASADSFLLEAASASDTVDLAGGTIAAAMDEAATASSVEDATATGAVVGRSAMLPGVFVNPGTSREANVIGIMVNQ